MSFFHLLESRQELIDLHEKLASRNGDYALFLNAIHFSLVAPEHPVKMFIYRVGDAFDPYFVAVHAPCVIVGSPLSGNHHLPTLNTLLLELHNVILPQIAPDTVEFTIDYDDQKMFETLIDMAPENEGMTFARTFRMTFRQFHMTEEQADSIRKMTLAAPEGFSISEFEAINFKEVWGEANAERMKEYEFEIISDSWMSSLRMGKNKELTRDFMRHLPHVCIVSPKGRPEAWALTQNFMMMSHVNYSGKEDKELCVLAQRLLAQQHMQLGYRPCKCACDADPRDLADARSDDWTEGKVHMWSVVTSQEELARRRAAH